MNEITETELRALVRKSIENIGVIRTAKLLELSTEATLKLGGGFVVRGPTVSHAKANAHRLPTAA